MSFVTTLRLTGGDRAALDAVVEEIRETVERKGAESKGPHTFPPDQYSVPLYKRSPPGDDGGDTFGRWRYSVYRRELEIVGYQDLARSLAAGDYPESVHVAVEVERRPGVGR